MPTGLFTVRRGFVQEWSPVCQGTVQSLYSRRMDPSRHLRIGELSRRVGVSPELLRAWERRFLLGADRDSAATTLAGRIGHVSRPPG